MNSSSKRQVAKNMEETNFRDLGNEMLSAGNLSSVSVVQYRCTSPTLCVLMFYFTDELGSLERTFYQIGKINSLLKFNRPASPNQRENKHKTEN